MHTRKQSAFSDYAEKPINGEKGVKFTSGGSKSESDARKQSAKTDYAEKPINGEKGLNLPVADRFHSHAYTSRGGRWMCRRSPARAHVRSIPWATTRGPSKSLLFPTVFPLQ